MKPSFPNPLRHRASERGFAVLALMMMLACMLVLVTANARTSNWLQREVKLVEKQQLKRLATLETNALPTAVLSTNLPPAP